MDGGDEGRKGGREGGDDVSGGWNRCELVATGGKVSSGSGAMLPRALLASSCSGVCPWAAPWSL